MNALRKSVPHPTILNPEKIKKIRKNNQNEKIMIKK